MTCAPVYVDFDDVLCETAAPLTGLLKREFGKTVAFEDIHEFNLAISFGLTSAECDHLMHVAHQPRFLSELPPIEGAIETIRGLVADAIPVVIVTGRPPSTHTTSQAWLEEYDVPVSDLVFVDKYGRNDPGETRIHCLSPEQLAEQDFLAAIDDSPMAIRILADHTTHHVIVFDRPWNRRLSASAVGLDGRLDRCHTWMEIDAVVRRLACL
jgi:hypothetical protein